MKPARIIVLFLSFTSITTRGQVYNYNEFSHRNFEINPSALASTLGDLQFHVDQYGFSASNNSMLSTFRGGVYLPGIFSGAGVSTRCIRVNDSTSVFSAGAGFARRTVLFDALYVKLGAFYKANWYQSPSGSLDYDALGGAPGPSVSGTAHTLNWSMSITTPGDHYFLSFGMTNLLLGGSTDLGVELPQYYFLHIGNFLKLLNPRTDGEFGYQLIRRYYPGSQLPFSHYVRMHIPWRIARKHTVYFGGNFGFADSDYFHLIPAITYKYWSTYKRTERIHDQNYFSVRTALVLIQDKNGFQQLNEPQFQIGLILNL